ncbi:Cationic amino acid transporter 9 chloroplastic [Bienertia sinuspersici]
MSEAPKLYVNKPKKAQLKQSRGMEAQSSTSSSTPSSSSSSSMRSGGNGGSSKPPEVPKESFVRRYKFFLPLILSVNLAVGAYLFMRTKKKDVAVEEEVTDATPTVTLSNSGATPVTNAVTESRSVPQHTRVQEPIPEQQQRELFKWMLEEKRKIKTKDPEEKRRIDEEKAVLKQFLRAKSIPSI